MSPWGGEGVAKPSLGLRLGLGLVLGLVLGLGSGLGLGSRCDAEIAFRGGAVEFWLVSEF